MNSFLFLFRAGSLPARNRKRKDRIGLAGYPGRPSPRPLPWATIGLPLRGAKPNTGCRRRREALSASLSPLGPARLTQVVRRQPHTDQIRHLMKKAPNGQFLWGAFALSFAALLSAGQSTPTPIAAELKPLQGYWEGEGAGGKCSITISGNSLHYRTGTGWYKTTFTLPTGIDPQQLHATIKDCAPGQESSVGKVVVAIYKIEDGKLTLAAMRDGDEETPKSFEAAEEKGLTRYELRRVQPEHPATLKAKEP